METVLYILARTVQLVLTVESFAFMLRAVLSWFSSGEGWLDGIVFAVTEPFILPVRAVMAYFNWGQDSPLDIAFFITAVLVSFVGAMLPAVAL